MIYRIRVDVPRAYEVTAEDETEARRLAIVVALGESGLSESPWTRDMLNYPHDFTEILEDVPSDLAIHP